MKVEYLETTFDGTPCISAWVEGHSDPVGNGETKEQALDDLLKKQERILTVIRMETEGVTPEDLYIPYGEKP